MSKNAVPDWSTNPALNTDIGGINLGEGMAPGLVNDAMRRQAAQIAAWRDNMAASVVQEHGTTARLLAARFRDQPFLDDWASLASGGDWSAALQAALNSDARGCSLRPNMSYTLSSSTPILLPTKFFLRGPGRTNTDTTAPTGSARLIFSGTAPSCFACADPTQFLTHSIISGINLRVTGDYDWVIDLRGPIAVSLRDLAIEVAGNTDCGILRARKIAAGDPSWVMELLSCNFRLPDASNAFVIDHDWSDSVFTGSSHFTGGYGVIDRGYGNLYVGAQFERSRRAGLTLTTPLGTKAATITSNFFDANKVYGIEVDASETPAGFSTFNLAIGDNHFRTVDPNAGTPGTADIMLANPTGRTLAGVSINGNASYTGVAPIARSGAWNITYVEGATASALVPFSLAGDGMTAFSRYGINIPNGAVVARNVNYQFRGVSAAGVFGSAVNDAAAVLGTTGNEPFIGASETSAGIEKNLRFYTGTSWRGFIQAATGNLQWGDISNLPECRLSVQGSVTVRGKANVAASFGTTSNASSAISAQVLLGATDGTTPFVAASVSSVGASDLDFYTANLLRVRIDRDGGLRMGAGAALLFDAARHRIDRSYTRQTLPAASAALSGCYAEVTNPDAGKSYEVRCSGTNWHYAGDQAIVPLT